MGHIYRDEGNYDKMIEFYKKAIELNDEKAMYFLGEYYEEINNVELMIEHYKNASNYGNICATYKLAKYYRDIIKKFTLSYFYLTRAKNQKIMMDAKK